MFLVGLFLTIFNIVPYSEVRGDLGKGQGRQRDHVPTISPCCNFHQTWGSTEQANKERDEWQCEMKDGRGRRVGKESTIFPLFFYVRNFCFNLNSGTQQLNMGLSHRLTSLGPKACMKPLQLPKFTHPTIIMFCSNSSFGNSFLVFLQSSALLRVKVECLSLGDFCVLCPSKGREHF